MDTPLAVVILAAGQGTRMKSELPKCAHRAAGRSLLGHVLKAVSPLKPTHTVVIVGEGAKQVKAAVEDENVTFATQDFSTGYGTGHALMQARDALSDFGGAVLVLNGDGPLLKTETLARLAETQGDRRGMTLVTCEVADPTGMGRIVRGEDGSLAQIVEEKDTTPEQKPISEVNPGVYIFDSTVFEKGERLSSDNAAGEYYITDLPALYLQAGDEVRTVLVEDETEVLGVNDRSHLAKIERILRDRVREQWLSEGVTMMSPETTFIDDTVRLEPDVTLEPGVILKGKTRVGRGSSIGAYAYLEDCEVSAGASVAPHTVARGETL